MARHRLDSRKRPLPEAQLRGIRRRAPLRSKRHLCARNPPNVSPPKCSSATRSPPTVLPLDRVVPPKSRSGRPWFLRKVRVPPTINTSVTSLHSDPVSVDEPKDLTAFSCPVPLPAGERILLGHGSGGRLSADLLQQVFLPALGNPVLDRLEDQASVSVNGTRLAVTTDSFVVKPLFFRGGDIGSLAVHGTINDLAMGGADPALAHCRLYSGRGLAHRNAETGRRLHATSRRNRGRADHHWRHQGCRKGKCRRHLHQHHRHRSCSRWHFTLRQQRPSRRHASSSAVCSGITASPFSPSAKACNLKPQVHSDSAPLHDLVARLLEATHEVRCLRDPTRGGLSSTLNEIAASSGVGMELDETSIPVREEVRGACEMLGPRSAVCCQRRQTGGNRCAVSRRKCLAGVAKPPAGQRRCDHWPRDRRPSAHGGDAHILWHHSDRRYACG